MKNDVVEIKARPLTERESGWIRDILKVNEEWRDADISRTQVVSEESGKEGVSFVLQSPEAENPKARSRRESVGELWIQTEDGCSINVQLSQFEGRLREMYVLFVDPKLLTRKLPETWTEVSREATDV